MQSVDRISRIKNAFYLHLEICESNLSRGFRIFVYSFHWLAFISYFCWWAVLHNIARITAKPPWFWEGGNRGGGDGLARATKIEHSNFNIILNLQWSPKKQRNRASIFDKRFEPIFFVGGKSGWKFSRQKSNLQTWFGQATRKYSNFRIQKAWEFAIPTCRWIPKEC